MIKCFICKKKILGKKSTTKYKIDGKRRDMHYDCKLLRDKIIIQLLQANKRIDKMDRFTILEFDKSCYKKVGRLTISCLLEKIEKYKLEDCKTAKDFLRRVDRVL